MKLGVFVAYAAAVAAAADPAADKMHSMMSMMSMHGGSMDNYNTAGNGCVGGPMTCGYDMSPGMGMSVHGMGMSMMGMSYGYPEYTMGMGMGMSYYGYPEEGRCDAPAATTLLDGTLSGPTQVNASAGELRADGAMSLITCIDQTEVCSTGDMFVSNGDESPEVAWSFDSDTGLTSFAFGTSSVSTNCSAACGERAVIAVTVDCQNDACAECKPGALLFEYTGSSCSATTNYQELKFECTDGPAQSGSGAVTVTSAYGLEVTYPSTGMVMVSSPSGQFSAETHLDVLVDGVLLQSLNVHTSCSKDLNFGDQFGALKLVGSECPTYQTTSDMGMSMGTNGRDTGVCGDCGGERPASLDFEFTGGACDPTGAGNLQGSKTTCSDVGAGPDAASTFALSGSSLDFAHGTGTVTVTSSDGSFDAETEFSLTQGGAAVQELNIHTSCSVPLQVGDVYGGLTLTGFTCPSSIKGEEKTVGDKMHGMGMSSSGGAYGGCDCHPAGMRFVYTGGDCTISNPQGGKASCSGGPVTGPVSIYCDSGDSFTGVAVNDTVQLGGGGRLGAQTDCTVDDGSTSQILSIHTSCSQTLFGGDVYGSLTVESWDCGDGVGYQTGTPPPSAVPPAPPAPRTGSCTVKFYKDGAECATQVLAGVEYPVASAATGSQLVTATAGAVRNMDGYSVALPAETVECLSKGQCAPGRCYKPSPPPTPLSGPPSCDCHPSSMVFEYTGGDCTITNPQGGKASCSGGAVAGAATITCDSGFSGSIAAGAQFTLGQGSRLGAQTDCTINDGSTTQTLSIHTSCSKTLVAGDVYGALKVLGWDCGDGDGMIIWDPSPSASPEPFALVPTPELEGSDQDCHGEEPVQAPCVDGEVTMATCVESNSGDGETDIFVNGYGDDECVSWKFNPDTGCFSLGLGEFNEDGDHTGTVETASVCAAGPVRSAFVAVRAKLVPRPVCQCHPNTVTFEYKGYTPCAATPMNAQDGKFSCSDYGVTSPTGITMMLSGQTVTVGSEVTVGSSGYRVGAETMFTLTSDGTTVQTLNIHTSCSKPLAVGDVFGSVEVVDIGQDCGANGGSMGMGMSMGYGSAGVPADVVVDFFVDGIQIGATQKIPVDSSDGKTMLATCPTEGAMLGDDETSLQMKNFKLWDEFLTDAAVNATTEANKDECGCDNIQDCCYYESDPAAMTQLMQQCDLLANQAATAFSAFLPQTGGSNRDRMLSGCCDDPDWPVSSYYQCPNETPVASVVNLGNQVCGVVMRGRPDCCCLPPRAPGCNNDPKDCNHPGFYDAVNDVTYPPKTDGLPSCGDVPSGGVTPCCAEECFCEYVVTQSGSPYTCAAINQEPSTMASAIPFRWPVTNPPIAQTYLDEVHSQCCMPTATPSPTATPTSTPSPTATPSPSPTTYPSYAQLEVNIPGLFFGTGQAFRPCSMISTVAPYFRICSHDYKQTQVCRGTDWWRVPIAEFFIRSKETSPGCLPEGTIAMDPSGGRMLPRLNTMSQWNYPVVDPSIPIHDTLPFRSGQIGQQGQSADTCMALTQPLQTTATLESGDYKLIPAGADGLPSDRQMVLPDGTPYDFSAGSCTYPSNSVNNTQRTWYLQNMAIETGFEFKYADRRVDSQNDVLGIDPDQTNDLMFGEGGVQSSDTAPQVICDGDQIFQFGVSSIGVKSIEIDNSRITNMRHRLILHIRQTLDPADTCRSEFCFNTSKWSHLVGDIGGDEDGIACFDAEERIQGSLKWSLDQDTLDNEYTVNGDYDFIQGNDLTLVASNEPLLTGVCMRCDPDHPVVAANLAQIEAEYGPITGTACNQQSCRACPVGTLMGPDTLPPNVAALNSNLQQLCGAAAASGLPLPYQQSQPAGSGPSFAGCPINDQCVPELGFTAYDPPPSTSPSPSDPGLPPSASPSPSLTPIYQMKVQSFQGQCVSGDSNNNACLNADPADEYTTRVQVVFERALPAHTDAQGVNQPDQFLIPPQDELVDLDFGAYSLWSRRDEGICWFRSGGLPAVTNDQIRDAGDVDFCELDGMAPWVPIFYSTYAPALVPPNTWPNDQTLNGQHQTTIAMAIDCRGVRDGPYTGTSLPQKKMLMIPIGAQGGPCWNDPEYGNALRCANGGRRGTGPDTNAYRNMAGDFWPSCPVNNPTPCARYFEFNCPLGSAKKVQDKTQF